MTRQTAKNDVKNAFETLSLMDKLALLDEIQTSLTASLFRVVDLSPDKFLIVFFDREDNGLGTRIIASDRSTVDNVSALTLPELTAYTYYMQTLDAWTSDPGTSPMPIDQCPDTLQKYRAL